jgi:hypothetical protein
MSYRKRIVHCIRRREGPTKHPVPQHVSPRRCQLWTILGLISQVCLDVVTFAFMDRWLTLGPRLALLDGAVLLLTLGLLLYCRAMSARDVLR